MMQQESIVTRAPTRARGNDHGANVLEDRMADRATILLVEDDEDTLDLMTASLESAGNRVIGVTSESEALAIIAK